MSGKAKKVLVISGLTVIHLLATANFSLWLFGYALAQHHNQVTPYMARSAPTMQLASAILEFPLVHLSRLIPLTPGSKFGGLIALIYFLSYILNSILWATVIYTVFAFAWRFRRK